MRIGLILPAQTAQWGGVQRFAASLEAALRVRADVQTARIHPAEGQTRAQALKLGWTRLHEAHRERPLDAIVSTFHYPPALWPGVPMLGFVHDVRGWSLQAEAGAERASRWTPAAMALRATVRTWNRTLVPSAHVRRDMEWLVPGHPVIAVGEGVDHLPPSEDRLAGRAHRDRVVLIAGRAPHKRAELGLQAAEQLVQQIAGPVHVVGRLPRAPLSDRIVPCPDDLDDAGLVALLTRAAVVLVPTGYEGFGLAAGEAMWAGAPVVYAADCPLAGVVAEGGVGVAPTPEALAAAAADLWNSANDHSAAARQAAARWTWGQTAERILEQCAEAKGGRGWGRRYPEA
jgi:glycosyltransferase involved in cell wall biosynthesis